MRNRLMIKDRGSSSSSSSSTSSSTQLPHHPPHTRKPKLALLREVFGRGGFMLIFFLSVAAIESALKSELLRSSSSSSFSPQVRSSAGSFLSTPALHPSGASPTPPCPTTTSDLWPVNAREDEERMERTVSCVCLWQCARATLLPNYDVLHYLWTWKVTRKTDEARDWEPERVCVPDEWVNIVLSVCVWMCVCVCERVWERDLSPRA